MVCSNSNQQYLKVINNKKENYAEDDSNCGSLIYKPDQTRIYFVESNGKIYYSVESSVEKSKQQQLKQTQPKRQQHRIPKKKFWFF